MIKLTQDRLTGEKKKTQSNSHWILIAMGPHCYAYNMSFLNRETIICEDVQKQRRLCLG